MSDFLATYLLHSTIILALTLALLRLPTFQTAFIRDAALRIALIAGLLTSALAPLHRQALPLTGPVLLHEGIARSGHHRQAAGRSETIDGERTGEVGVGPATPDAHAVDWVAVLLLGSIIFAVTRFGAAYIVVRRRYIGRVDDPHLRAHLQHLVAGSGRRGGIEVCWTRLPVPCALGTRYILLPHDVQSRLSAAELDAVLAHECAHLLRRDPLWNLGLSFLTHLLWFQPLNWVALRAWRDASEEVCDAWAAQHAPCLTLAQAILTLVQQGQPSLHGGPALLTSQAARSTHLSQRIHALIEPKETPMKRPRILILALVPSLLGAFTPPLALASTPGGKHLTVVLDAAHGGRDPGVVGLDGHLREDDVVLDIAKKVQARLEKQGVTVILTRNDETELSLQDRVRRIPSSADAFICIHVNAPRNPADQGVETFIARQEAGPSLLVESRKLADRVQAAVVASTGAKNEGVTFEDKYNFYVLRKANVPAALIEVGYMTNEREAGALQEDRYRERIAEGIARGVVER
ncbi:M56/M15 family metallopeptidase [Deinococcus planocerae]|uniref:M56/M15 family metallopeptidase n=1 Tax=Deinococcus planocerae TaxID=1737569 RepID=UPI000C7EC020|nr:M56/M15 family metallopeptidase [Deinococcus planocerae]